ncbi:ribonuclease p mrp protein subunit pop5-like [Nannochloropsis oceanica]
MRVRLRYLTCKLDLPLQADTARKKTTAFEILKTIKESIQINFGDFGIAALLNSLQIRYYDEATHIFILRCSREGYRSAWAAMTLLTSLGGGNSSNSSSTSSTRTKASISVLRVSGSVRTCRTDAVEILVMAAKAAAAACVLQQQMEEVHEEDEEWVKTKRIYYQTQIEGAIQGV